MRWFIEKINAEFSILENGVKKTVKSFGDGKQTIFPGNLGRRTAYRFDFSDQHILPKTLELESASTWVCYDSKFMTSFYAFLAKIGLFNLLRFQFIQDILFKMLKTFHWGSDIFIIKTEARGMPNHQQSLYECSVSGNNEERATGLFAADVAERLYTSQFSKGVFHIEQLFEPLEFIKEFCRHGFRFHHDK
jgi:saccharopine dehydrogenase-like NADP-dependent oxidoreductase